MQSRIKRLIMAALLGITLALGVVAAGPVAHPSPAVACGPIGCTGTGGGG